MAQSVVYSQFFDRDHFVESVRRYRVRGVKNALDLLVPRYTLHIVAALQDGERHFNQLLRDVDISSNTLRSRLKSLEEQGIVARRVESYIPPSVVYRITEKGLALSPVIEAIFAWEKEWINWKPAQAVIRLKAAEPKRAYGSEHKPRKN